MVWSVNNVVFLSWTYKGWWWPVLYLAVSSSHWQCSVSVLIIAELARGHRQSRNLWQGFESPTSQLGVKQSSGLVTTGTPPWWSETLIMVGSHFFLPGSQKYLFFVDTGLSYLRLMEGAHNDNTSQNLSLSALFTCLSISFLICLPLLFFMFWCCQVLLLLEIL